MSVTLVSRWSSSKLIPKRISWVQAKMLSSLLSAMYATSSSRVILSNFAMWKWHTPVSKERTDFKKHSSRVEPMPITSPVAFI